MRALLGRLVKIVELATTSEGEKRLPPGVSKIRREKEQVLAYS